jgi:hypothetical protein
MAKFTAGPWIAEYSGIESADGWSILTESGWVEGNPWIASAQGTNVGPADKAEVEANAHLIASAPDLYEALKDVAQLIGGWREAIAELEDFCSEPVRLKNMIAALNQCDDMTISIRAALAKADGKAAING